MELFVHKLILAYNSKSAPGIISNSPAIHFSDNFDLEKLKIRDGPLLVHLIKLSDMCVYHACMQKGGREGGLQCQLQV